MTLDPVHFDLHFKKLVRQFRPRIPEKDVESFAKDFYESVNELTNGEWQTCVQTALRECRHLPRPAEIHGFNARHSNAKPASQPEPTHWTTSPIERWVDSHGHHASGRRDEPNPWRAYRRRACPSCACGGQGWVVDNDRTDPPIGFTPSGGRVYPCPCTRGAVEVEYVAP